MVLATGREGSMAASARVGRAKLTGKEGKQDLPKVQRRGSSISGLLNAEI